PPRRWRWGAARDDLDVLDRNAEFVGHDLAERGLFALAVRLPADVDPHYSRREDPHDRRIVLPASESDGTRHLRRPRSTDLDERDHADAEVAAALPFFGLI